MPSHLYPRLGAALALSALAACGATDTTSRDLAHLLPDGSPNLGDATVSLPVSQSYDTIDGTAGVVSIIEGVGTTVTAQGTGDPVGAGTSRFILYGYRDSSTGEVVITDTKLVMTDTDGNAGAGTSIFYSNTDTSVPETSSMTYNPSYMNTAANYDYARMWRWATDDGAGTSVIGDAMAGVTTAAGDMPATGTAAYTGDALTEQKVAGSTTFLRGPAEITANFDNGTVDAFTRAPVSGAETIAAVGMQIDGNSFSGGNVYMLQDGIDVKDSLTGGVLGEDAAGHFYGPAGPNPAEVGGLIVIDGATRSYHTFFLAD